MRKRKKKDLYDCYRFDGFIPDKKGIKGKLGDSVAIVIPLKRTQKKQFAEFAVKYTVAGTIRESGISGIYPVLTKGFILKSMSGEFSAKGARQ